MKTHYTFIKNITGAKIIKRYNHKEIGAGTRAIFSIDTHYTIEFELKGQKYEYDCFTRSNGKRSYRLIDDNDKRLWGDGFREMTNKLKGKLC